MEIDNANDNTLEPIKSEEVTQKRKRSKITLTTVIEKHTTAVDEKLTYLSDLIIQLATRLEVLEKRQNDTDRIDLVYGKVHEIEGLLRDVRSN